MWSLADHRGPGGGVPQANLFAPKQVSTKMGTLTGNLFGGLGDPFGAGGVRRLFESPISLEPSWTEGWLVFPRGPKGEGCVDICVINRHALAHSMKVSIQVPS